MADVVVAALERIVRTRHLRGGGSRELIRRAGLVEALAEAAAEGPVRIRLGPSGPVVEDPGRGRDRIWFGLFRDGARELLIRPDVVEDDVVALVEAMCAPRTEDDDSFIVLARFKGRGIQLVQPSVDQLAVEVDEDGNIHLADTARRGEGLRVVGGSAASAAPKSLSRPSVARSGDDELERFFDLAAQGDAEAECVAVLERMASERLAAEDVVGFSDLLSRAHSSGGSAGAALLLAWAARSELLLTLFEREPEDMEPAIDALGRVRPMLVGELIRCVEGAVARQVCIDIAGAIGVPLTGHWARVLAQPDPAKASHAIQKLREEGSADAYGAICAGLEHPVHEVRYRALRALDGHFHPAGLVKLEAALEDTRPIVRKLARRILESTDDPGAARVLDAHPEHTGLFARLRSA